MTTRTHQLRARPTGFIPHTRTPQKRLPARTAGALEEIGYDPEPSMKLSRAVLIVIIMHVIAVGGMYLFQHLRDSRLARTHAAGADTPAMSAGEQAHAAPVARATPGTRIHYVEPGQSLSAIAKIYSVTVEDIARTNRIADPEQIHAGQELQIPSERLERAQPLDVNALTAGASDGEEEVLTSSAVQDAEPIPASPVSKPRAGDPPAAPVAAAKPTATPGAAELGLREQFLRARRGAPPGEIRRAEPASSPAAAANGKTYVVKKGDNPVAIARKFQVSYPALLSLNNITDPRKLQVGQTLKIPGN